MAVFCGRCGTGMATAGVGGLCPVCHIATNLGDGVHVSFDHGVYDFEINAWKRWPPVDQTAPRHMLEGGPDWPALGECPFCRARPQEDT